MYSGGMLINLQILRRILLNFNKLQTVVIHLIDKMYSQEQKLEPQVNYIIKQLKRINEKKEIVIKIYNSVAQFKCTNKDLSVDLLTCMGWNSGLEIKDAFSQFDENFDVGRSFVFSMTGANQLEMR